MFFKYHESIILWDQYHISNRIRDMSILSQAYEITMSSQLSMEVIKQYGLKAVWLMVSNKLYDSESSKYNLTSIFQPFKSQFKRCGNQITVCHSITTLDLQKTSGHLLYPVMRIVAGSGSLMASMNPSNSPSGTIFSSL